MRNARVDSNQSKIVETLRAVGATVLHSHMLGHGAPDIIVGYHGVTYLFEIKDGSLPPSGQRFTPDEERFHKQWRGHAAIVTSTDEALQAIGAISNKNYKEGKGR